MREAAADGFVQADGAQQFTDAAGNPTSHNRSETRGTLPGVAALIVAMNEQRFGDDIFDPKSRIERSEGILKDDLHIAPQATHFAAAGREQVFAFEINAARCRLDQPQDQPPERALARTGFAYQPERFAGMNVERDVVDGADFPASRFCAERRFVLRINSGQVANFDERHKLAFNRYPLHSFKYRPDALLACTVGQQMSRQ